MVTMSQNQDEIMEKPPIYVTKGGVFYVQSKDILNSVIGQEVIRKAAEYKLVSESKQKQKVKDE